MEPQERQEPQVLQHLKRHREITSWDAIQLYGITRLAEIIRRLKKKGHTIDTELRPNAKGGQHALYVYRAEKGAKSACDICKQPLTNEELIVGHCFNCGEQEL